VWRADRVPIRQDGAVSRAPATPDPSRTAAPKVSYSAALFASSVREYCG